MQCARTGVRHSALSTMYSTRSGIFYATHGVYWKWEVLFFFFFFNFGFALQDGSPPTIREGRPCIYGVSRLHESRGHRPFCGLVAPQNGGCMDVRGRSTGESNVHGVHDFMRTRAAFFLRLVPSRNGGYKVRDEARPVFRRRKVLLDRRRGAAGSTKRSSDHERGAQQALRS